MTDCTCNPPADAETFHCGPHDCIKNQHLLTLCRTREDYRKMWDGGHGPGQPPAEPRSRKPKQRARGCGKHAVPAYCKDDQAFALQLCRECEHHDPDKDMCKAGQYQMRRRFATQACPTLIATGACCPAGRW